MVFDCELVTKLVIEWQTTQDNVLLSEILENSRPLVEAIVSTFDREYRDDLIQESMIRVQRAIASFNPRISNLYNYLSVVVRNICITYLKKIGKDIVSDFDEYDTFYEHIDDVEHNESILEELIQRNRIRFSSIPVEYIDNITEFIYHSLSAGGNSGAISDIMKQFDVERSVASVVYRSTVIYLRSKYMSYASGDICTDELSLMRDLEELLGHELYAKIALMFHGTYIRIS